MHPGRCVGRRRVGGTELSSSDLTLNTEHSGLTRGSGETGELSDWVRDRISRRRFFGDTETGCVLMDAVH